MGVRWDFRNVLALVTVLAIFSIVWGIGSGMLKFSNELVQGIIIGGIMRWGAWIYMFYFRKKGPAEDSQGK